MYDAVVVGGGFYGVAIAAFLKRERKLSQVLLVEREGKLLNRASYTNQARVHNGYHYPRSFTTAYRSRINAPEFVKDFEAAVFRDFRHIYAIARKNSKVTARQFERFCHGIGAELRPPLSEISSVFDSRLIEAAYEVSEYAFDAAKLASWAIEELAETGVEVMVNATVLAVRKENSELFIEIDGLDQRVVRTRSLFNCTYSGLNQIRGDFQRPGVALKHEIAELALVEVPPQFEKIAVTVMDGPFFSLMPFPARNRHSLSHVRYTPHLQWIDKPEKSPYAVLDSYTGLSRFDRMRRDAARYIPSLQSLTCSESLYEVKTVLLKSEGDDGRPILFERHSNLGNCYSILGGKIDNIYDVLAQLRLEIF